MGVGKRRGCQVLRVEARVWVQRNIEEESESELWYYHSEEEVGIPDWDESKSKRGEVVIFVIPYRYMQSKSE